MTVAYDIPAASRPNPQKRNLLIQKLARAPWWLLAIAILVTLFAIRVGDQHPYPIIWNAVKQGIWTTIWVSVVAYTIAVIMGLIVALLRRATLPGPLILKKETGVLRKRRGVFAAFSSLLRYGFNMMVYQLVTLYVEAVRGIPTLVLVYYMALAAIPQLIGLANDLGEWLTWLTITINVTGSTSYDITFQGIGSSLADFQTRDFPNEYRAIIGLAISYSAFLSEVFRAGIDSIGTGQREAAASLGMTRWQQMRLIVLPQAIRIVIPPLANDFIAMLKESSLVSILGVEDITRQGQTYAASTFRFFEAYNVVALTYLVLTLSLSMLVKLLEMYMGRGQEKH
jgi:polar amino acid transport system permease protein